MTSPPGGVLLAELAELQHRKLVGDGLLDHLHHLVDRVRTRGTGESADAVDDVKPASVGDGAGDTADAVERCAQLLSLSHRFHTSPPVPLNAAVACDVGDAEVAHDLGRELVDGGLGFDGKRRRHFDVQSWLCP